MLQEKDIELDSLDNFNEKLSVYINLYMDTPNYDAEKLHSLQKLRQQIDRKLEALLSAGFAGWTSASEALRQDLQDKNQAITAFIEDISQLKKQISNTAAILALIDKALELAAGIAAKCATA